jgi:hypothetical protein
VLKNAVRGATENLQRSFEALPRKPREGAEGVVEQVVSVHFEFDGLHIDRMQLAQLSATDNKVRGVAPVCSATEFACVML